MTNRWMLGTALAALIVASPALAQSDARSCDLAQMSNDEFLDLDADGDDGLSRNEYRACLDEAELSDDEIDTRIAAFTEADRDADGILRYAEVQTEVAAAGTGDAAGETAEATVTVRQPAAEVTVEQPGAEVEVTQAEPTVEVEQAEPEVNVRASEPQVAVTQAEPTVSVEQAEPSVSVEQPAPEVSVEQPEADVAVSEGEPAVAVDTPAPEVEVAAPEPQVSAEPAETAEGEVEADGTADVAAESGTAGATGGVPTEASSVEADEATMEAAENMPIRVNVAQLEGADVMNNAGEEVGEIDAILLDPAANTPVVIISVGGVLGIGDKEIAFPYSDLTITADEVVLNTDLTGNEIEDMDEYDEDAYEELPASMIVD